MIRLFAQSELKQGAQIRLEAAGAHYLHSVMRVKQGAKVTLFNGKDGEWEAVVHEIAKRHAALLVERLLRPQHEEPRLTLAFAPTKNCPTTFVVQKATELGATSIVPLQMQRSIVKAVNMSRLQAVAVEAAEQSQRLSVPSVLEMTPLNDFVNRKQFAGQLFYCTPSAKREFFDFPVAHGLHQERDEAILIGPEGGLSPEELALLEAADFGYGVTLGPTVLRADTAFIAALSIYQCWTRHNAPRQ